MQQERQSAHTVADTQSASGGLAAVYSRFQNETVIDDPLDQMDFDLMYDDEYDDAYDDVMFDGIDNTPEEQVRPKPQQRTIPPPPPPQHHQQQKQPTGKAPPAPQRVVALLPPQSVRPLNR